MINPLFLEFIRKQLAAGISHAEIQKVLKINGLSPEEIEEGFSAAASEPAAPTPQPTSVPSQTPDSVALSAIAPAPKTAIHAAASAIQQSRPQSMTWFEIFMYASIAVNVYLSLSQLSGLGSLGMTVSLALAPYALVFFSVLAKALLVYTVSRRRQMWAFIILIGIVLFSSFGLVSMLFMSVFGGSTIFSQLDASLLQLVPFALEMAAMAVLLFTNARTWLFGRSPDTDTHGVALNMTWKKTIPKLNTSALVVCGALFLLLDTAILYVSPDLFSFWAAMAGVFAVQLIFYYFENSYLSGKLSTTQSPLDPWLTTLVSLRNFTFLLNFIPFIQLLGLAIGMFAGIPYLIIYSLLLYYRLRTR